MLHVGSAGSTSGLKKLCWAIVRFHFASIIRTIILMLNRGLQ